MRIHARPILISFESGQPTQYGVSVVGIAPHKTYFIEQDIGTVPDPALAPSLVGQFIHHEMMQKAIQDTVEKFGPERAQMLYQMGQIEVALPEIPGVTGPGTWENPRFGNPERHRQLHSLKARDERAGRVSA